MGWVPGHDKDSVRSEPVESLFAPPISEPMTTTKTARDIRNTGRPFSNHTNCLALEEVAHVDLISLREQIYKETDGIQIPLQ